MKEQIRNVITPQFEYSTYKPELTFLPRFMEPVKKITDRDELIGYARRELLRIPEHALAPTLIAVLKNLDNYQMELTDGQIDQIDQYLNKIQFAKPDELNGFDTELNRRYVESRKTYGYFIAFDPLHERSVNVMEGHTKLLRLIKGKSGNRVFEQGRLNDERYQSIAENWKALRKELIEDSQMSFRIISANVNTSSEYSDDNESDMTYYGFVKGKTRAEEVRQRRTSDIRRLTEKVSKCKAIENASVLFELLTPDERKKIDENRTGYVANMQTAARVRLFTDYKDPQFREFVNCNLDENQILKPYVIEDTNKFVNQIADIISGAPLYTLSVSTKNELTNDKPGESTGTFEALRDTLYKSAAYLLFINKDANDK